MCTEQEAPHKADTECCPRFRRITHPCATHAPTCVMVEDSMVVLAQPLS